MATSTVSKIKLIDGTIVNLSNNIQVVLPANGEYNVTWEVTNLTGNVTKISGTTDDYLLTVTS